MKKGEHTDIENTKKTGSDSTEKVVTPPADEGKEKKKDHTGGLIVIVLLLILLILALLLLIKHPIPFHKVNPPKGNDVIEPIAKNNIVYHSMQFASFDNKQNEYKDNKIVKGKNTLKTPQQLGLVATNDQYTFAGWTTDIYLPTTPVEETKLDKTKLIDSINVADGDVHVYAVWSYKEPDNNKKPDNNNNNNNNNNNVVVDQDSCVLTFHMNAVPADLYQNIEKIVKKGDPYTITFRPESVVDGVAGIGWSKQPYPLIPAVGATMPEEITQVSIQEDTTLYAIWGEDNNFDEIADCKEVINVKYVSKEEDITYKEGQYIYYFGLVDDVKVPRLFVEYIEPQREGYQFVGWEFDGIDPKTKEETTMLCQSGEEIAVVNADQYRNETLELRAKWASDKDVVSPDEKPIPPTGDQSNRSGYVIILVISAAAIILLGVRQYKNKKNK